MAGAAVGRPVLTTAEGTLARGTKVASGAVDGMPGGQFPVTTCSGSEGPVA